MWRLSPVLLLLLFGSTFTHQWRFDGPTPASRLDLLFALVVDRTVVIDDYHANTPDKAFVGGHYYSDKAPGTVALALPAFAAMYGLERWAGRGVDDRRTWLACSWAACAFSQALPAALGGTLLLAWLRRHVRPGPALVAVVALWLGSLPLPYSTMLFSHAQVIGLISIAVWALDLFGEHDVRLDGRARGRCVLAGFCLGLVLASEYTAGLVVLALGAWVLKHRRAGFVAFMLGALPPLSVIPAYSWVTIGTPFDLPYSHQATFAEMSEGLYAIKWPDFANLLRLLFGPTRGLVFWTPFLLMAVLGWRWMGSRRPRWLWLTYAVPLLQAIVISGRTWDWQAGFTLSARYLAPVLPLLVLPCALGVARSPRVGCALAVVSVLLVSLATLTDACPIYSIQNPLTGLHLPKLLEGSFSPNLVSHLLGLSGYTGLGLFYTSLGVGVVWAWRAAARAEALDPAPPVRTPTAVTEAPATATPGVRALRTEEWLRRLA